MVDLAREIRGPACHENGITGHGYIDPEGKQVMLLGISPARAEIITGVPMVGPSGNLINGILTACGWSRDRVYTTNLVCHESRKPSGETIMGCWNRLQEEVAIVKPKLVVLLGQLVATQFFGTRPFTSPKGNGIRGVLDYYKPWGCYVMPTYHPAALLYGEEGGKFIANDIVRDFSKIPRFFDEPPRQFPGFYVVESVEQAQTILNNLPRDRFVALDIETPLKDEDETAAVHDPISCFSISDGERTWWFPGAFAMQVTWPVDVQWTYHNGPYDTITLSLHTGLLLPIVHDTMAMSACLDERGGVHGLKTNLRETEAVGFYEEEWGKGARGEQARDEANRLYWKVTNWDAKRKADPEGFKKYNAIDAWGTARLAERYYHRLKADGMERVYNRLLLPAFNTYRLMQRRGLRVSSARTHALLQTWVPLRDAKVEAMRDMARQAGFSPKPGSKDWELGLNPKSPVQLKELLYGVLRLPGGPSTDKEALAALAGMHPIVDALEDIRHLNKALDTYVVGVWNVLKYDTARVHPWAKLHGTMSGRVAYFNPAINTQPRATSNNPYLQKLKSMYVAEPGFVLVEMDYKQAECWMAAVYSNDPQLWADLRSGDLHTRTAASIHGIPEALISKAQRQVAKNSTFGKFFLIGVDKFAKQNNIPRAQAQQIMRDWDERYKEYPKYVKACYMEAVTTGELVSLTGRKRRYPCAGAVGDTSIMPETTNFKIQSTSHDCLMDSIVEAYPVVSSMGGAIVLDIHDAMLMEVRQDNWMEVAKRVRDIMQKPRFDGLPGLPCEVKVGPSWDALEEVELD